MCLFKILTRGVKWMEIDLNQKWTLGSPLGRGGFGSVFEATNEKGDLQTAIKLIPKGRGADRELLFEDDLSSIRNIIPIIDSGEFDSNWIVVMPRAEKSLRDHLKEKGSLSVSEALNVLSDIATSLSDMTGKVVHRDLKPDNILLLGGKWCISDFGIARYAEASTAAETFKYSGTEFYHPPERWHGHRATSASDMYSFGIMAFEIITGQRPFPGTDPRREHITQQPPKLTNCPPLLTALVDQCLMKAPEVRPSAENFLTRLGQILRPSSGGASLLQAANLAQSDQAATEMTARSAAEEEAQRKREIVRSASQIFSIVLNQLEQAIHDNAPAATIEQIKKRRIVGTTRKVQVLDSGRDYSDGLSAKLGPATLTVQSIEESNNNNWGHYKPIFQVLAHTTIDVKIPTDRYEYEGRGHSLWYCDAEKEGVFHWYETAYMFSPLIGKRGRQNPFSLLPGEESGKALSRVMTEYQVAWPFTRIEVGNEHEFIDRWLTWFAQGAVNQLSLPSSMPERITHGTWRH